MLKDKFVIVAVVLIQQLKNVHTVLQFVITVLKSLKQTSQKQLQKVLKLKQNNIIICMIKNELILSSFFVCKENMRHGDFSINHAQEYAQMMLSIMD